MRISLARALRRYVLAFVVIAGGVVLMSATTTTDYTVYDREYYLAPDAIQFVRSVPEYQYSVGPDWLRRSDQHRFPNHGCSPGRDGTPPLDITGVNTPGPISVGFLIAYIPSGQI